jgi:hypothetical protein
LEKILIEGRLEREKQKREKKNNEKKTPEKPSWWNEEFNS